ncbi:MAG: purine-nucleoside phosphorylase [Oligoflexia bacterium]|nr:purine-nucleoside phosphorylase [Oligoflexia bacterium]
MYEKIADAVKYIQSKKSFTPRVGVVLGSGLGCFGDFVENKIEISYKEIPNFFKTTIEGHKGKLLLGDIAGVAVAVLQGRVHYYEGHSIEEVVFPVRVLSQLGIKTLILTNASGGVNCSYRAGDLVLIEDHIDLTGNNPLVGPNLEKFGPRFPDMTYAYNREISNLFVQTAREMNYDLKKGVYCGLTGPSYETPAEIRMLRILGADMVGMSTVAESIAANHMGVKVAAISCVTNMAAGLLDQKLDHEEVKIEANKAMNIFTKLLTTTIAKL